MRWPLSQDFNEAVQCPGLAFTDPDLKTGQAVVGAQGLPLPRSGNFADVYQVRGAAGRDFAVKCFTRPVVGLDTRYEHVSRALAKANLPFAIGFTFLAEGIRVAGEWRPVVKMDWIDGLQLNQFVRENAGKPAALDGLLRAWVWTCKRLREAGIAHADLQHGNVLLVPGPKPGTVGLTLIDYDGMYVPALANRPSGETGHPSYQHPERAAKRVYSPDLDRFPHLVVAAALKGIVALGPGLWDRYDTGDNLLFSESDFQNPAASPLMRELWQRGDPAARALVGHLALACRKPIPQTPWLDQLAPEGVVAPLSAATAREAADTLGFAAPVAVPAQPPRARKSAAGYVRVLGVLGAAVLVAVGIAVGAVFLAGGKPKPDETTQVVSPAPPADDIAVKEPPPSPKPPPEPVVPPKVISPPSEPVAVAPVVNLAPTPRPVVAAPVVAPRPRLVTAPARLAVPVGDALARAESGVRAVFKDDYARKQPADKKALAQKLLTLARGTADEPANRYVMLRDAQALAVEAGDPVLAAQAIDALAKWYDTDPTAAKLAALEKVLAAATSTATLRTVHELAGATADAAADADDYAGAVRLAQTAVTAARKGNLGAAAAEDGEFRLAHLKKTREAFDAARPALERLRTDPDDPDANLAAGKFRCFTQGRWADGVKLLAKGASPELRLAGELELAAGPADVKAGDAWWDAAQLLADAERRAAEARARHWYVRAVGGLTGLPRARAESRLGFTHNAVEYRPGLLATFETKPAAALKGKKSRIDPVIDYTGGEFADTGGKQVDVSARWSGVIVPPRPGRYRLIASATDPVRVRVGGRTVIDTITTKGGKREGSVLLLDQPAALVVEFAAANTSAHQLRLNWVPPGETAEERVPAAALFHDRKTEPK